jgi:hypothetical protein
MLRGDRMRSLDPRCGPRAPYQGLSPFTEEQAAYFFGRDDDVGARPVEAVGREPVVALADRSGAGESSLLRARSAGCPRPARDRCGLC